MAKLSAGEKELLAYTLQNNLTDPSLFQTSYLAPGNDARTSGTQDDVGDRLVIIAKNFVTANTICVGSIPFLIANGVVFLAAPNPFSAGLFLVTFTTFVISREVAIKQAAEVGRLKGVAEAVTDVSMQKELATVFYNNAEKALSMTVDFRNLAAPDAGLRNELSNAFIAEQLLENKDSEVKSIYAQAKAKASVLFGKLTATYPAYAAVIGHIPQAKMSQSIEGSTIVVKGVSDSRINFVPVLSGSTRKVRISSTATTDINFTLQVAYKRTLDNKEFTKDIACTFKPTPDSTEMYKASVVGTYRVNNYQGNGPNTELYCDANANGQLIYRIYKDPSWPDGTKFYAGWTIIKENGRYYFSSSGFYHFAFSNHLKEHPLTYPVTSFQYHNGTVYSK